MKNLTTLLKHSASIQAILFLKSKTLAIELTQKNTPLGEVSKVKIQINESLCSITNEPLVSYCKKNKLDLKVRGATNKFDDPVTEIEFS